MEGQAVQGLTTFSLEGGYKPTMDQDSSDTNVARLSYYCNTIYLMRYANM